MCIFKLSDLCFCSSQCACGVAVIDMYHHRNWQIMESYAPFMTPLWAWVRLTTQQIRCEMKDARQRCGSASNLDLLIPTLLSCPDRNQACHMGLYACNEDLEPIYTQFSNPSFSKPTWTVSLLLWDKLSLVGIYKRHTVPEPTASHVDYDFGCENLLAKQPVWAIKFLLMKRNISLSQSPFQMPQTKRWMQGRQYVGQSVDR